MNEKALRNIWIGTTALIIALFVVVFTIRSGAYINLFTPFLATLNVIVWLGIMVIAWVSFFCGGREKDVRRRETSLRVLVFYALLFPALIASYFVTITRSITLDLLTGLFLIAAVLLISGYLWILRGALLMRRAGYPVKDERIDQIRGKAEFYTLGICLSAMGFILLLITYLDPAFPMLGLSTINAIPILVFLLALTLGSYVALNWYFGRRSDS
jgi:small-conductance mechanosensitive channel